MLLLIFVIFLADKVVVH